MLDLSLEPESHLEFDSFPKEKVIKSTLQTIIPMDFRNALLAGLTGGIVEIPFYVNDMEVFSEVSYHVLRVHSIPLGVILHLVASLVIAVVSLYILERVRIMPKTLLGSLILGLMFGSSVLSLFSLPIHLTVFPLRITITYVASHLFYGVFTCLTYFRLRQR